MCRIQDVLLPEKKFSYLPEIYNNRKKSVADGLANVSRAADYLVEYKNSPKLLILLWVLRTCDFDKLLEFYVPAETRARKMGYFILPIEDSAPVVNKNTTGILSCYPLPVC